MYEHQAAAKRDLKETEARLKPDIEAVRADVKETEARLEIKIIEKSQRYIKKSPKLNPI